ncbi:MAG: hypothetical protein H0X30_35410 [Anaerolineae bacterium]|nr:hypothetical protein [Anaerolineae bacterium]
MLSMSGRVCQRQTPTAVQAYGGIGGGGSAVPIGIEMMLFLLFLLL